MRLVFSDRKALRAWARAWKRYAGAHDRRRTPLPDLPLLARMPRSLRHVRFEPLCSNEELEVIVSVARALRGLNAIQVTE